MGVIIRRLYIIHRKELKDNLAKRWYNNNDEEKQLQKVDKLNRNRLPKYKQKKKKIPPLILSYSDGLPDIHTIVKQRMSTLYNSERMKENFPVQPLVACRSDKDIKDI